jgi:hypothetical protein
MDYLHVEEPFLNRHFRPARTDKLRYLDLIHYAGTLREELGLDRASPSDGERRTLHAIEERIRADFEIDVDVTGKEDIGYVAIEPGTGTANGRAFEVGVQSGIDHEWSTIEFDGTYTEPAFIADMQTVAGPDSSGLRYRNLTESSVDVRVEEEQSNDDEVVHAEEDVGYLVAGAASSEATLSPSPNRVLQKARRARVTASVSTSTASTGSGYNAPLNRPLHPDWPNAPHTGVSSRCRSSPGDSSSRTRRP